MKQVVNTLVNDMHCELYQTDARGETALTTFAGSFRLDLVIQLLLCGYDPNHELKAPKGARPDQSSLGLPVCRAVWELDVDLLRSLIVFGAALVDLPEGVNLKHVCFQTPTTTSYSRAITYSRSYNLILCLINWYPNRRWRRARQKRILGILDAFGVPNCTCFECTPFDSAQGSCREVVHETSLEEFLESRGVKDTASRAMFCRVLLEEEECQKIVNPTRVPRTGQERLLWLDGLLEKANAAAQCAPFVPDTKTAIYMLSLDGGGVKGLVPLHYLISLQRMFKRFSNEEVIKKFNFLAGTSTGAIIASGILCGVLFESKLICKHTVLYTHLTTHP